MPLCLVQPQLEPLHRFLGSVRPQHFDQRRRAANERRLAGGLMGVLRECAHAWQMNMHMRVNKTGKHVLIGRVKDLRSRRRQNVRLDARYPLVRAPNVRKVPFSGGDDFAAFHQHRHKPLLAPASPL